MEHFDLIHTCLNSECLKEDGVEASSEERGDVIHVLCGKCHRKHDYPKESLNRTSLGLVAETLRGFFEVTARQSKGEQLNDGSQQQ